MEMVAAAEGGRTCLSGRDPEGGGRVDECHRKLENRHPFLPRLERSPQGIRLCRADADIHTWLPTFPSHMAPKEEQEKFAPQ
jgi:hypothetical protein